MKKSKVISLFLSALISVGIFTGCNSKQEENTDTPDGTPTIEQVRNICKMSTLECYYHNVAKSEKIADSGLTHIGEKDRKFWIEYTGIARLGVDMSKVKMDIKDEKIKISLPKAEIQGIDIEKNSLNKNSYISSEDGFNSNEITADDQAKAIDNAQKEMKISIQKNSALLTNAQSRAKTLIENYIKQLGKAVYKNYEITWDYQD